MLKTLDLYIIKKFLSTFFFTVLIFTMISVVIDFSENVERFIESEITAYQVMFGYYPGFIMFIAGMLWPLFTLIAVVFFTSRMAYNSEIISIFNAGISFRRLAVPYLIAASIIAAMHLAGNHYFIPETNKIRLDLVYKYIHKNDDEGKKENVHINLSPNSKVFIHQYYKQQQNASKFRLEGFKDNELVYLLKANEARWLEEEKKWRIKNYEIRTFNGNNESIVIGYGQEMDTTLNLSPQDFVDYKEQHNMMNTARLSEYIDHLNSRGGGNVKKYQIEKHRRTAEPFTIFILTIIGMAIAARKVRGGMGINLALGLFISAIFIFLSKFSIVFASSNALPLLAGIWFPNVVFSLVALYLVAKAQK